jgi:hypothetical protein
LRKIDQHRIGRDIEQLVQLQIGDQRQSSGAQQLGQ